MKTIYFFLSLLLISHLSFSQTNSGGDDEIDTGTPEDIPVELTYFEAYLKEDKVIMQWETASENNAAYFAIQRSSDKKYWETIGRVNARGNSQSVIAYKFEDNTPLSDAFYRLKQVDLDGANEIFGPIQITFTHAKIELCAQVMPNNVTKGKETQIQLSGLNKGNDLSIQIFNNRGEKVWDEYIESVSSNSYLKPMEISRHHSAGIYYILIKSGREVTRERLFIR
ncbi:T9SS type A sorting domain-containing protein [Flammeovirga sp. EKP202]|uniref:T9SS type A sorting domain-containing protein n=1 Tax=Flammeovirga sp. EKP202 TaxID=2770592 RepID=UPI00165EF13A|nr:T9SS type A sorting domain-containing protein [Flammeovirga sp. EKP202]MBD0399797.1 T9SS type A sorting domain-containing protein [Flammeovirga sp. EKP202]